MADYDDVTLSFYRDVSDDVSGLTSETDQMTSGCLLYKFVVDCVNGLVCILGFIGNLIAFVVFYKDTMKTSTSFLFQALSVIDNVLIVTVFPLYFLPTFVDYTSLYPDYEQLSSFHQYILVYDLPVAFVAQTATIWVTVLVAVNRYIAVCRPYQAARLCTVGQAKLQLCVVLTCVLLYNVPRFCEAYLATVPVNSTTAGLSYIIKADYTWLGQSEMYRIIYYNILYAILMLAVPLIALSGLNVRLIRALTALRRKRAEMQGPKTSTTSQDNNVTLVLVIVVLVFTVCQTPALATQLMWSLLADDARGCGGLQFYFGRISNLMVVVNSAANFPVYLFFNTRFRQVLGQMVGHSLGSGDGPVVCSGSRAAVGKAGNTALRVQETATSRARSVDDVSQMHQQQLEPLLSTATHKHITDKDTCHVVVDTTL